MNINTVEKLYTYKEPNGLQHNGYELTLQDDTKLSVPLDLGNRHYQAIQEWIAEGGVVIDNPPSE